MLRIKNIKLLFGIAISIVLQSCISPREFWYEVTNNDNIAISGKTIILDRVEVARMLQKNPDDDFEIVVYNKSGVAIPSQLDDMDGDGKWDELVFQVDLRADENVKYKLKEVKPGLVPVFEKRTNIHFSYKENPETSVSATVRTNSSSMYQFDGPGWENDIVGFRNYYMFHNGMDIFGKKTTEMVLDNVGRGGENYQEMQEWGMDILHVGRSLGAGAIALAYNGELFRIGECKHAGFEIITQGPVRSVIELSHDSALVGERYYDIIHQISICAGDHFYRSKVWVSNLMGDEKLVTGIADFQDLAIIVDELNEYRLIATHGKQAFLGEELGIGLIIPTKQLVSYSKVPVRDEGISQTVISEILLQQDMPAEYIFFAGWVHQDLHFASEGYFVEKLRAAVNKLSNLYKKTNIQ